MGTFTEKVVAAMDEQLNLFSAMGEPLPPMQVVCDYLRSSYDNWLRHRLPEEKVRPFEAGVNNTFKTWHGHSLDRDTWYWFISFRPSSVTLKSNDGLDIDFSRTAVLRALGIKEVRQ